MTLINYVTAAQKRWAQLPANLRAVLFVSAGAILLTVMAVFVKILGERMSAAQLMFCRALVGFLIFAPWLLATGGFDVIRTKRPLMHLQRGFWGACGNFCFFYAITHLVLADAMALQFSRPLFMILLAFLFLGEIAGRGRIAITFVGFAGILVMLRPFGGGFDPDGIVAVSGAVFGGMVVICIKKLASTEPTRRIIFRHMVPNVLGPVIVYTTLTIPAVMLLEAFLSFLGLGVQPPTPSWGLLIKDGADRMREAPWMLIYPGIMFALALFSFNFVGDGLRDALDPKTSKD